MRRIHVLGPDGVGKTTLIEALVCELTGRGLRVGTLKRSGHAHELDTPGKDTYRHRSAGAAPAAIATPGLIAVFAPQAPEADPWLWLERVYDGCDLVIVEGGRDDRGLKVEVWRAALGTPTLASEGVDVAAVVTDDPLAGPVPVWPLSDVPTVSNRLLALLQLRDGGRP